MATTVSDVILSFLKGHATKTHTGNRSLYHAQGVLYSYGRHFPLAVKPGSEREFYRPSEDEIATYQHWGQGVRLLINGDRSSPTTNRHQRELLRAVRESMTVQIPFSALQEAWNWAVAEEASHHPLAQQLAQLEAACVQVGPRNRILTPEEYEQAKHALAEFKHSDEYQEWSYTASRDRVHGFDTLVDELQRSSAEKFQIVDARKDRWEARWCADDGRWSTWMQDKQATEEANAYCEQKDYSWTEFRSDPNRYQGRHFLASTLFKIRDHYFLSGFDEVDIHNYFLCHVPGQPKTVHEALEALKPELVKQALAAGVEVVRQGDWFFIPAEYLGITGKTIRAASKTQVSAFRLGGKRGTHVVTRARQVPVAENGAPVAIVQGIVRHKPPSPRRPEHRPHKLGEGEGAGKSWWYPVQNTSLAGWSARGQVD